MTRIRGVIVGALVAALVLGSTAPAVGALPATTSQTADVAGPVPPSPYGSGTATGNGTVTGSGVTAAATATNFDVAVDAVYGGDGGQEFGSLVPTREGYLLVGHANRTAGYAVKVGPDGATTWERHYVPEEVAPFTVFNDATRHPDGGYVFAGTTARLGLAWLVRTDADGDVRWSRTYGEGSGPNSFRSVTVTPDGEEILAAGVFTGVGSVVTVAPDGDIVDRDVPSGDVSVLSDIAPVDGDDAYLVAGTASEDAFAARFDVAAGEFDWTTRVGGDDREDGLAVVSADGGAFLVGSSGSSAYDGTTSEPAGLVARLSADGETRWATGVGPEHRGRLYDVAVGAGGVVAVGVTDESQGTAEADALVVGLDADDRVRYTERLGGGGHQDLIGVVGADDGFAAAGDTLSGGDNTEADGWFVRGVTGEADDGDDGDSGSDPTTAATNVTVSLSSVPGGLRAFDLTVAAEGATIEAVAPGAVGGSAFQQVAGGANESSVTVRAADLAGTVQAGDGETTLLTVTFDGDVSRSAVSVAVSELVDDAGDPIDESRLVVDASGGLFAAPLPDVGSDAPPTDPDDDGSYEDVDGDGEVTFEDAISLAFADTSGLDAEQRAALDFDGDGDVDFDDAVNLAFQV